MSCVSSWNDTGILASRSGETYDQVAMTMRRGKVRVPARVVLTEKNVSRLVRWLVTTGELARRRLNGIGLKSIVGSAHITWRGLGSDQYS